MKTFLHFFTILIAPIVSNGMRGRNILDVRTLKSKGTETAANLYGRANHFGYPTFFGRRVSMGAIP